VQRVLVREVQVAYRVAKRRARWVLGFARSSFRYKSRRNQRAELRVRLRDLAASRVHYGYQRLWVLLRREGWIVNKKLVYGSTVKKAWESGGESHVGGRVFRFGKHGRRPGRPMRAGAWTSWPISWSAGNGSGS
jgi:transposase InsO family protein